MKKNRILKQLFFLMAVTGALGHSSGVLAAAFQLWEQDGASVGNYHAGRAAIAEDASTAYYNPAGLVRIPNQELVLAVVPITIDFLFDGTIAVEKIEDNLPMATKAQGGTLNFVPGVHYAAPIFENLVFGLSLVVPFGLQTNYGDQSIVRYSATKTSLKVFDIAPSLAFAFNQHLSIGAGADIEYSEAQFNLVATVFDSMLDSFANNSLSGHGVGYHAGILYQFTPQTRIGLAYQSKVTHDFTGTSKFTGPLANFLDDTLPAEISNDNLRTTATVPATTTLSFFSAVHRCLDIMATVNYTQWSIFKDVILYNVSGIDDNVDITNNITVVIPQNYRNTWNYAVGANYHVNERWFLRAGGGYDETPSNNEDRNLQLPDSDRVAVALGTHFQPTKNIGFDISWTHFFTDSVPIDVAQQVGGQLTTTKGTVTGNADVYGFQMKWDIV